ncbi:hypothetical protein LK09_06700 [Microbacterium mangrovi]|uniref:DUF7507 domain-containing protein n=1 Tax=Microbacterium mangrovi TaxID=1348253 RepID=A0A0B2AAI7_9MICO|nr:DUF11 domain-containing protein [Microbacterium mangrovi]KHK98631.1 hypothetical protein LK09_06700 [Microbacterium mangrovi]
MVSSSAHVLVWAHVAGAVDPGGSPSPSPSPADALGPALNAAGLIWALCGAMLVALIALLIYGWPSAKNKSRASNSVVRSWLAVSLTAGLLIFTAASFGGNDGGLQKMLVGAVIAAVGGAGAFYFATKANETATSAILQAAKGSEGRPGASTLLLSKTADASKLTNPATTGNVITYHFKVTNSGTDALTDVAVSDSVAPPKAVDYVWPGVPGELKAGEVATATSHYQLVGKDLDAKSVISAATATGRPPHGAVVRSEPEHTTTALGT